MRRYSPLLVLALAAACRFDAPLQVTDSPGFRQVSAQGDPATPPGTQELASGWEDAHLVVALHAVGGYRSLYGRHPQVMVFDDGRVLVNDSDDTFRLHVLSAARVEALRRRVVEDLRGVPHRSTASRMTDAATTVITVRGRERWRSRGVYAFSAASSERRGLRGFIDAHQRIEAAVQDTSGQPFVAPWQWIVWRALEYSEHDSAPPWPSEALSPPDVVRAGAVDEDWVQAIDPLKVPEALTPPPTESGTDENLVFEVGGRAWVVWTTERYPGELQLACALRRPAGGRAHRRCVESARSAQG